MKNIVFLLVFLFTVSINAQNTNDSIIVKNAFIGHSYFVGGTKVSRSQISDMLISNSSSQYLVRQSRVKSTVGYVCLGGALASSAFIVNEALKSKKEINRLPLTHSFSYSVAITSCVWVLGIGALFESNHNFQKSIKKYNSKNRITQQKSDWNYNFGLNYVSLSYKF